MLAPDEEEDEERIPEELKGIRGCDDCCGDVLALGASTSGIINAASRKLSTETPSDISEGVPVVAASNSERETSDSAIEAGGGELGEMVEVGERTSPSELESKIILR